MKEDTINLDSAYNTANLLVSDLRQAMKSDNPYLQELIIELLESSVKIEQKLKRLRDISE